MRAIRVPLRVVVAATMLVAFALDGLALGTILEAPNRVVAVGDVHGAYDDFVALLEASDIIGADLGWAGGNTILVQTGDLMDRGSRVRAVLDLMMVLEAQAPGDGGRVISLLGNHEVSNLIGYLDYRSTPAETYREIFASFADDKSEKRRRRALRRWDSWLERYPNCAPQSEEEWLELHPPGFVEYFDALGPDGGYGRWLRSRDIAVRIDGAVFVHGGLSPELIELGIDSLEEINRRIREELKQFDANAST